MRQVRDYRQYFNRPDAAEYIREKLGFVPTSPRMAVLIGRLRTEADIERINSIEHILADEDVRIITYDEVLDRRRQVVLAEAEILKRLGHIPL